MNETPAELAERYAIFRKHQGEYWSVTDVLDGRVVNMAPLTWAAAHELCCRLNRGVRAAANRPIAAPAPCPDCARLRAALTQIARCSGEAHILRLANTALDEAGGDNG